MKRFPIAWIVPIALGIVGVGLIYSLAVVGLGSRDVALRLPGGDGAPAEVAATGQSGEIKGVLKTFDAKPADIGGSWPWFRGANFDAIHSEDVPLAKSWPDGEPKKLWSVDLGEGYAGAAINAGMVYVIDYDRPNASDAIRCFSLADGAEIWRYSYPIKVKRNHGMSRTVPAVTDDYIVTIGPKCHVTCLDAKTGEFLWMIDLVRQYGTKVPLWYAGQCPFIDDGKAIIAPGGESLMIAVDCATGEIVWDTPNPNKWQMTHSSIIPMTFDGRKTYVSCSSGATVGVLAEDGKLLWQYEDWSMRTNVPTPVLVGGDKILLSAGYRKGSMMIQLEKTADGSTAVKQLWKLEDKVFGADQSTPVYYKGYIYGVRPGGELVCLSLDGEIVWTSPSGKKFGLGPYMIAGGVIYILSDEGLLTMAEASAAGYTQIDEAQVLSGHEAWAPMAMAAGRLIVRDFTQMVCLDIGE
jgi:outer membrane protein assembly factor BamB